MKIKETFINNNTCEYCVYHGIITMKIKETFIHNNTCQYVS